jgi:uncharacterized membrane protein YeaQ/YmgE (transglycosylase-associated protein family)
MESFIIFILVGLVAGWLAGQIMKGGGFGLIGDIVVGIVGGVIAGWLLPGVIHIPVHPIIEAIITSFIGAVILLLVIRLIKRA